MNLFTCIYVLVVLLLNYQFIDCVDGHDYDCKKLKQYQSFQTHLIFKYEKKSGTKTVLTKNYEIKETFHRNREKLEVVDLLDGNDKKVYIFDFRLRIMYVQDLIKGTCRSEKFGTTLPALGTFAFKSDDHDHIGPTALYILHSTKDLEKNDENLKLRDIDVQECRLETNVDNRVTTYKLFLVSKDYKIDERFEPVLKIEYKAPAKIPERLNYDLDYISFKQLNDDKNLDSEKELDGQTEVDFWYIPDYCVEKDEKDKEKYPRDEIELPKKYEFKIRKVVDGQTVLTTVLSDKANNLVKLSDSNSNDLVVLDLANHVQYKLNLSVCLKMFNDDYEESVKQFDSLIEILDKLNGLDVSTYIGKRQCRGLGDCETFSFYLNSHKSILYTFYLRYDELLNEHHLINIKKQHFQMNGQDNELISTVVYEVYDFKSLDHDFREAFDLSDCSNENKHKIEIRLAGVLNDSTRPTLNDYEKLEHETLNQIIDLTGLNPYNFHKVEVDYDMTKLIFSLVLIQPINDLIYYNKMANYSIPLDRFKPTDTYSRKSLEECATLSEKNGWLGIQYCSGVCYSINDSSLFELDNKEKDNCTTFKRIENSQKRYIQLPFSVQLIEKHIADNKFKLSNGFAYQSLDNQNEFNDIEKSSLFNLIKENTCLNDKKLEHLDCKLKGKLSDCIFTCQSTNCNMFSVYRQKPDQLRCCFIEQTFDEFKDKYRLDESDEDYLIENSQCSLYELSYLIQFNRLTGKTINSEPLSTPKTSSTEQCAAKCLQENNEGKSKCLSFSYCSSSIDNEYVCELRAYNHYVLNDETNLLVDSHSCSLYSANFLVDYHKTEMQKLENFTIFKDDFNLQKCAKACKDNEEHCSRFNFCKNNGDVICQLETNETAKELYPLEGVCNGYHKNEHLILDDLIDKPEDDAKEQESPSDYSFWFYLFFFSLGVKIGVSLVLARRAIKRRKVCGNPCYVRFDRDGNEDSVSIGSNTGSNSRAGNSIQMSSNRRRSEDAVY